MTHGHNQGGDAALQALRPQIQDLRMENIADLAMRARELGGVIPLWYGEGDMVTPAYIRDAAKAALDEGVTFYIPDMRGHRPLIEALSDYQSRLHGVPFGLDRSTVTPGGMQAVHLAMTAIADAGRNVVFPEPQWPNIANAIHVSGAEPRGVPMDYRDGRWVLDLDRLFDACDARTRAIVYSSPSNPQGWVAREDEIRALLEFGRRRGIWIIADEVYARMYFAGPAAPSILPLAEPEDLVMTVNTLSKGWAMTGWRVGWLTHPPSLSARFGALVQYMTSGTAGVLQAGAAAALRDGEGTVAEIRARAEAGIAATYDILDGHPAVELPARPEGGMYVFFRLRGVEDARDACRLVLERARVGLAPGHLFGPTGRSFLRMCILRETTGLREALSRMADALR
jgi:aspartate/methionine/tyrosine aminotransferase